jgi:glycosyltransferase involved in cell wall biosynthesis
MNEQKIDVYHFVNGYKGGVYHIVKNIVQYSSKKSIDNHIIYILQNEKFSEWEYVSTPMASSELIFRYSKFENLNLVYRRLAGLLPPKAIFIAHDWFELGLVSHLGLSNPLIFFVHGCYSYYHNLYKNHKEYIDLALCVSKLSVNLLSSHGGVDKKIFFYRVPVKDFNSRLKTFDKLSIVVIAENLRDPNKGLIKIKLINEKLKKYSIPVEWHFAGTGFTKEDLNTWWGSNFNVPVYYGYVPQHSLQELYDKANIYLLPSQNEGVPVTLIEAMKAGCIPIVALWGQNVEDVVVDGNTGYVLDDSKPETYVKVLIDLFTNKKRSQIVSQNASLVATAKYNLSSQIHEFEEQLQGLPTAKTVVKKFIYGSRLDKPWIPNIIVITIRKLMHKCRFLYFQLL